MKKDIRLEKIRFGDFVEILNGSTPSTKVKENFGGIIPWITPKDLSDQQKKYIETGTRNITEKGLKSIGNRLLPEGTILLTSRAPIGLISIAQNEISTNQGFKNIVCNEDKIDNEYLYYLLGTLIEELQNSGTGTTFKEISKRTLENFEFFIINNLGTQKKIAKVLSDLDAKIELNNKINQELEAMAKTLYDYWFVQFDFPAYLSGTLSGVEGYKSSGGRMVYNEELKREIPEGWEVGSLMEIADYVNGLACQKYRPIDENHLPVIKIKEMNEGFSDRTEKVRADVPERIKIYDGDILFSWSASLDVIQWTGGNGALNQHIFKVTSDKYPKSYYYFELLNYLEHFKMIAELRKTTMGHITREHLNQSRIAIPPKDLVQELDVILKPILDKKVLLDQENQKLAALRDWLLPMLMNGQVTVEDAYVAKEEVLGMVAEDKSFYRKEKE